MTYSEAPIFIFHCGRTGSSLLAAILAEHGVWSGRCHKADPRNPLGYFENVAIHEQVRRITARNVMRRLPTQAPGSWKAFLERTRDVQGYKGGPWMVKIGAIAADLFLADYRQLKRKPTVIVPRRHDKDAIFRSIRKARFCGWLTDEQLREFIQLNETILDELVEDGAFEVDSEAVIAGDRSTLRAAIEGAGIEYDDSKAERLIDPKHWHG